MTVAQLRSDLQASRDRIFAPLRDLNEEQFRHVAQAGAWSIATHLAHLLRCERLAAERIARALREDEPLVTPSGASNDDDPVLAQHLAVPQIIHGMQAERRAIEHILDAADAETLERAIAHERDGRVTVRALVDKVARHEREHADEVARLATEAPPTRRVIIPLMDRS
jgi:uncharacterized damage-inducible protein DinB